jgi:hypothetical protein
MLARKPYWLVENLRSLKLFSLFLKIVLRLGKFHDAVAQQLHGVTHGILQVFNTILYKNEFQNPQSFHQPVTFSPKRSTF